MEWKSNLTDLLFRYANQNNWNNWVAPAALNSYQLAAADAHTETRFTVLLGRSLATFIQSEQDLFKYEILNTQN